MESVPFVVDISSNEEEGVRGCLEEKVDETSTDHEWMKGIKGFLEMCDEKPEPDEVLAKISKEGDDDDCLILEGDPEKLVTTVNDLPNGSDLDELFVVGEKGQIACRDYPHPRHLCANFPYSSTPHQRHCRQCHCYVCDSPAPCPKWGTGLSSTDHCHATDKSETWKTLRQNFKLGKTASSAAPTNRGTFGDVVNFQHNHTMNPLDVMKLSPNSMFMNQPSRPPSIHTHSLENLIPQNQASQPAIMYPYSFLNPSLMNQVSKPNTVVPLCSKVSNFATLHSVNHGRFQESGSTLVRNKYQSNSVRRHELLRVRNHVIQRHRVVAAKSLRTQFLSPHTNEVGSCSLGLNHSTHGAFAFTNHVNPTLQNGRYDAATGFSNSRTCFGYNDVGVPKNLLYPQPRSELPYEPQTHYQSNDSQNYFGNYFQGNAAPPSSYMAHLNRNHHLYKPQIGTQSQHTLGNILEYQRPHESQSEYARMAGFAAFDSSWVENTSNSISCLQSSGSMNIPNYVEESSTQFNGSTNLSGDDIKH